MSTKPGLLVRSWNVSVDLQDCTSHTLTQTGLERRRFIHELYDEPLTWMILYEYDMTSSLKSLVCATWRSLGPGVGSWTRRLHSTHRFKHSHFNTSINLFLHEVICVCVCCLFAYWAFSVMRMYVSRTVKILWQNTFSFPSRFFVCIWEIKWRSWSCRIWVAATNTSWTAEKLKGNGGSE